MAAYISQALLPKRGSIWRSGSITSSAIAQSIRKASQKSTSKTKPAPKIPVLEKPAKFNPPSHGAKLRKDPPRYPGPPLSSAETKAQRTKKYPNMMPAEGTFMHWFLNDHSIHLFITLGTLFSLASYASITHFKRTSKFADMLPPASDLFFHPISFGRTCLEIFQLHVAHTSAEAMEKRSRIADDVTRRNEYRKKHGVEVGGFGGWMAKMGMGNLDPAIQTDEDDGSATVTGMEDGEMGEPVQRPKRALKKWLGIW